MQGTIKNWKFYFSLALSFLCFSAGYSISKNSWNGEVFIYLDSISSSINSRNIASVAKEMNIPSTSTRIKGTTLKKDRQKALVSSSRVENLQDVIQLYLGHLLINTREGVPILACQKYQTVDLTFIAPEVSSHGHVPKMILTANCKFNPHQQPLHIGPFTIPKKTIINSPVDRILFTDQDTTLLFSDISIQWPKKWILSQVRFANNKTDKDFVVAFSSNREEDFLTFHLK